MKMSQQHFVVRALVIAVRSALAGLAGLSVAYAQEANLTQRGSEFEVGVGVVGDKSAKFGEFNGLDKKDGYLIGGFDLNGGDGDAGLFRWRVRGSNLGLDTRNIQGELGSAGSYRLTFGYDELVRNFSDTYRTIFNGAGTTAFTLPASYPAAATRQSSTASANAALSNWNNIQSPYATAACAATGGVPTPACQGPGYVIPALMQNFDIGTKRTKYDLGYTAALGANWEFRASARRELKDGTKLTGVNMNRFTGPSTLLPEPISSTTDQLEASFRYADAKSHFSIAYAGSFYKNDIDTWTIQYPGAAATAVIPNGNTATMSGAPDNQMHQLSLAGGYNFSRTTRLVVEGAHSRMTQNEAFLASPSVVNWFVPESSAHAKVINTSLLARLTSRPMSNLGLNVAYRYNNRDNRTPILDDTIRTLPDIIPTATTVLTRWINEPINRRLQQFNLDGDFSLGLGQAIKAGYEWQEIRRTADGDETPFRAEETKENTLRVEYRNNLTESVTGRLSYAYSKRKNSGYEEGDPRPASVAAPDPQADPFLPGFRWFFLAERKRDKLRGSINFQPAEAVSLQAGLDYNRDSYTASPYGLKNANSWQVSLDGAYTPSEKLTLTAYYTYEDMKARFENLAIARGLTTTTLEPHAAGCAAYPVTAGRLPDDYWVDPCRLWSETQADRVHTVGIGFKSTGLIARGLEFTGNLNYSQAKTPIAMTGGTYYSNGLATLNNVWVAAESLPEATNRMVELRLMAKYPIDKVSAVRVSYLYRRLTSSDWQWDAYSNSSLGVVALQGYIGPGITSPRYSVNVLGVSYIYSFR